MEILNQGFDHVEYSVHDLGPQSQMVGTLERMGFEKIGDRTLTEQGTQSVIYAQGFVRIILTRSLGLPSSENNLAVQFLQKQAEGICVLAIEVKDATRAFEETVRRGARPAREPKTFESAEGSVTRAEIWTPGNVRYAFMERHAPKNLKKNNDKDKDSDRDKDGAFPILFDEGLRVSRLESPSPFHIRTIDHLTNNVGMGQMKDWVQYYQEIFQFRVTRHFNIRTQRTGLLSDVVESPDGKIKVPINEPTEPESQIQEFVNRMKGSGVQHLAFLTTDIQETLGRLRAQTFKFLTVPHTYYDAVPTRVPGVTENLKNLEELGILLDGDSSGYLLQIFSEEILGPFFFEYIQRKGNRGFGEGNFHALFEAIERDQIKRGVLKS